MTLVPGFENAKLAVGDAARVKQALRQAACVRVRELHKRGLGELQRKFREEYYAYSMTVASSPSSVQREREPAGGCQCLAWLGVDNSCSISRKCLPKQRAAPGVPIARAVSLFNVLLRQRYQHIRGSEGPDDKF
jgi:hypothetical protein